MSIDLAFWNKHIQSLASGRVLVEEESHYRKDLPPLIRIQDIPNGNAYYLLQLSPNLALQATEFALMHPPHASFPINDYYVKATTFHLFTRMWFPEGFEHIQPSPWVRIAPHVIHINLPYLNLFLFQVRVPDEHLLLTSFYPEQYALGNHPTELLLYSESNVRQELLTSTRRTLYAWSTPMPGDVTAKNFIDRLATRMARSFGGRGKSLFPERAFTWR
jgi:hypothetical protein